MTNYPFLPVFICLLIKRLVCHHCIGHLIYTWTSFSKHILIGEINE